MKKIMFNDKYGLTEAVLSGRKTMTRRIVPEGILRMARLEVNVHGGDIEERFKDHTPLCYLDEVAIAQPYKDICLTDPIFFESMRREAGWSNKMFVKGRYMPHRIRITNIKVERLQDISEEDIYKEGFEKQSVNNGWGNAAWHWETMLTYMDNLGRYKEIRSRYPQEAFGFLIDKLSGYGTWDSNPWVYAYTFELLR